MEKTMQLKDLIKVEMQKDYSKTTLDELLNVNLNSLSAQDRDRLVELFYSIGTAIEDDEPDLYTQLVELYGGSYDEWVQVDYGCDSKTGTDFWCENCRTGQVLYINLEADGNYTFTEES